MNLLNKLPPVIRQLFWFTLVGGIGFIVDAGILQAGLAIGLGFYAGRALSYLCAATTTWALNRRWTFKAAVGQNRKREWGRFLALNTIGGAVNYGVYVLTLQLWPLAVAYPVLAVGIGSAAGLLVNFAVNKYFVFKPPVAPVP